MVENAMLPLFPPQEIGFVAVPAAMVGADGSLRVLAVASLPVQPALVMLNSE